MIPCVFLKKSPIKYRQVLILILLLTWPFVTIAQQREEAGPDQAIALPAGRIRLDSLGSQVAHESGFVFSFNSGKINPGKKIFIPGTLKKLDGLLAYLDEHYGLRHSMIGNHIIFSKRTSLGRTPVRPGDRQDPVLQKRSVRRNKPKTNPTLPGKVSPITPPAALPDIGPGIAFRSASLPLPEKTGFPAKQSHLSTVNAAGPAAYLTDKQGELFSRPSKADKRKKARSASSAKENNNFCVSAGLSADEVLYIAPGAAIGLPRLFATASWASNFKASGLFYGLGTSIRLSDSWDFQLSASSGVLSQNFRWPTPVSDTMIKIKSRLTRINLLAEKHLSNRLTLQFGPVLNFMKNNYILKDSSITNSFPSGDMSKDIHILNLPYTLNESYNKKTGSGIKIWIGLRVGLFYTLW